MSEPFHLISVAHLEAPAGLVATSIDALRDAIERAPDDAIFQHVTRLPIRHPHARDLPGNDFARWVRTALQAPEAAERLAFAGYDHSRPIAEVRAFLLEALERVPARDRRREAAEEATFHFISAYSVRVPLEVELSSPLDIIDLWPKLDPASVFYHMIEAPARGAVDASLVTWLDRQGAQGMARSAAEEVAEGRPLERLRRELGTRWRRSQIGRRIAEKAGASEAERRRDATATIARLAGRLRESATNPPPPEPQITGMSPETVDGTAMAPEEGPSK